MSLTKLYIVALIKSLSTVVGDANLDGTFDSNDLVTLFMVAEYEDGTPLNST